MKVEAALNKVAQNKNLVLGFLFILFGAFHLHISLVNHYLCRTYTYDFAVYNFAFYDFAHFKLSPCPLYQSAGDVNFLQDHFSLTLPVLSPLYWLMSPLFGTYSLLLIQWGFIMLGAFATYRLVYFKSGNFYLSLCALLFYFTIYCRFAAYNSDCNLVIMGSALLPVFYFFFETKRYLPLSLVFLALVFNREDFSLGLLFFCIMLMVLHRKNREFRNLAAIFAVASMIFFVLIFVWIIPALETPNKAYNLFNYTALGKSPKEALLFVFTHPFDTLTLLFKNSTGDRSYDAVKLKFYLVFFLSGGFVLLYRPAYLIALIPLVAKKMWNDAPVRWSHEYYQGIEIATILPAFVFLTLMDIRKDTLRKLITALVCVLTIEVSLHQLYYSRTTYYGVNKCNVFSDDFYEMTEDTYTIKELVETIPDTSAVCASGHIAPHLAFRDSITLFPRLMNKGYLFLEKRGPTFPMDRQTSDKVLVELLKTGQWDTLYNDPGIILLARHTIR